jgi:hypothetical protein
VGVAAFLDSLDALGALTGALDDRALLAPSRCLGWLRMDALTHLHLGLQEMLTGMVAVTDAPVTVDFASYWTGFLEQYDEPDPVPHVLSTRRMASSTMRPSGIVRRMEPFVVALRRTAAVADPEARIVFQDFVMTVDDFATTWAVEHAVHHLDITNGDPTLPPPAPAALADTRRTLVRLFGGELPDAWDDETAALKGSGRLPLDAADREALGAGADRFPLIR